MNDNKLKSLTNVSGNTYNLSDTYSSNYDKEGLVIFSNNVWKFAENGDFTWDDNNTITLSTAHTTGATSNTFTKTLASGTILSLSGNGGSGATRTVNATSPGTVAFDVKENATFTADVIVSMDRASAKEKIKTLSFQTTANINPNTHINGLSGPFGLGYGDIYQLSAVYQSSSFAVAASTANTNVTAYYTLDNGQRDYAYEHGTITPDTGYVPTGRLLAVFDNFTHDTTQGLGYTSVNSYPIDDTATANTTINTKDIPSPVKVSAKFRREMD